MIFTDFLSTVKTSNHTYVDVGLLGYNDGEDGDSMFPGKCSSRHGVSSQKTNIDNNLYVSYKYIELWNTCSSNCVQSLFIHSVNVDS